MRLFVSAGEPSGDLHGSNLIRSLREMQPGIDYCGFGGERMAAAGCHLVYPLVNHAVVGIVRVLKSVPDFAAILRRADRFFRQERPDALVMIDFPGFHWWLAKRARQHGIPVIYFVPPQLWAWASWRVKKMRERVDKALCTLPFEEKWFRERGVAAEYIGHPYFDELRAQHLDAAFLAEERFRPGPVIALLPGSRNSELSNNLDSLLRAAAIIHARRPNTRFLVACLRDQHRQRVEEKIRGRNLPIEVHAGRTPEIIHLAHSCIAVSGSVGLELLYHGKPSVVTYREHWSGLLIARMLMQCRYISLVNLLAEKELFPEYLSARCEAENMAAHVLGWLNDDATYQKRCDELAALRETIAKPGACERAARCVLEWLSARNERQLRAA
jgi:lipid-A-disaccharide synthase